MPISALFALLLQADDMGAKAQSHVPGQETGLSLVAIILLVVGLIIAVAASLYMVVRGGWGALRQRKGK